MDAKTKKLKIIIGIVSGLLTIAVIVGGIFLFILHDKNKKLEEALELSNKSVEFQRKQKDEIRNLWEDANAKNDDLTFSQVQLFNRLEIYQKLITKSIGFENGKTIVIEDINRGNLKKAEDDVYFILKDIDNLINTTSEEKIKSKEKVDEMYIKADEDQRNRINYLDGIR